MFAKLGLAVLLPPHTGICQEFAGPRLLGDLTCRTLILSHASDVCQDVLPALEGLDQHSERVVGIWHHVRGKPASGIPLIEPRLEFRTDVAVRIPAPLEQFRPLAN